jgi:hypothetical protein
MDTLVIRIRKLELEKKTIYCGCRKGKLSCNGKILFAVGKPTERELHSDWCYKNEFNLKEF